jgi:hypothetical protein
MTHWSLSNVLFSLQFFEYFLLLLLLLSSGFYCIVIREYTGDYFNFLYLLRLALCPKYDLVWRTFHGLLRRMYFVLFKGRIFCRYLSVPLDLWSHLILRFLCWLFCLDALFIVDRAVLKSPTTTVLGSVCSFKSIIVWLMTLGTLTLGAYKLIIVISSWCIAPFIIWSALLYLFWIS